ncbi:hypothetical protein PSTT_03888, partial [Puccinia striiformis]
MVYLDKIQEWLLEEHNIVTCVSTIDQTLCKMEISLKKKSSDHFEALRPEDGSVSRSRSCGNDACRVKFLANSSDLMNHQFAIEVLFGPVGVLLMGNGVITKRTTLMQAILRILLYGVLGMDIKEKSFKRPDFELFSHSGEGRSGRFREIPAQILSHCGQNDQDPRDATQPAVQQPSELANPQQGLSNR